MILFTPSCKPSFQNEDIERLPDSMTAARFKENLIEKKCLIVSKSSQSIVDESCSKLEKYDEDKAELFWHMLQDNQPYTTQVRKGMEKS